MTVQPLWTTIIRTTGNRNETLKEAILSVAAQTYRPVSVIVSIQPREEATYSVTVNYVRSITTSIPITTVRADPSKERGNPINVGLDNCQAEYISLLDDDDILYPTMGATLIKVLQTHQFNFAYGNTIISRRTPLNQGFVEIGEKKKGFGEPFSPIRLAAENYLHPSSIIYSFKEFGKIRTHEDYVLWEDWYLYLQMLFTNKLKAIYIDHDVSEYRLVGSQDTNSFHTFPVEELKKAHIFIKKSLQNKTFSVDQEAVFKVFPEIALISEKPNDSTIQHLLDKIHYFEELQKRKCIRMYLEICQRINRIPTTPSLS